MGQYAPSGSRDPLWEEIVALKRQVAALQNAAPLRSSSISDGGQLVVNDRDGSELVLIGRVDDEALTAPDGTAQMMFRLTRSTGEVALEMIDPLPALDGFHQFLAIRDRAGNPIVADDTTSGQGLAFPLVPITFADYIVQPTATTISGSFTTLQRATLYKQQPYVVISLMYQSVTAGTTGEIRFWNDARSEQIGNTIAVNSLDYARQIVGPFVINGEHLDAMDIDVQGRRTAGTGTIGARVLSAYGWPSP